MSAIKQEATKKYYSPQEYLAILEASETKVEYLNGEIRFMAGGTPRHSLLCSRMNVALAVGLGKKSCDVYNSDLKVWIDKKNSYVLPDVSVICNNLEYAEKDKNAITNPTIVVEVASESSFDYDYGTKLKLYRHIQSLRDHIIVNQDEAKIDIFSRKENVDIWLLQSFEDLEAEIYLESLDISIPLAEIYEGVNFDS